MLLPFDRPVDGQADGTMQRELHKGLHTYSIGQVPRLQTLVMQRRDSRLIAAS